MLIINYNNLIYVKITMIDKILKFIFPHHCYRCQKLGTRLCDSCKNYILKQQKYDKKLTNWQVLDVELRIFGWRRGLLAKLIDNYKFHLQRELARPLAELLASLLTDLSGRLVIVPIPTTRLHNRQRGFDHMKLIGKELAHLLGVDYQAMLVRQHQVSQRGLSRADRLKNAKNSFSLALPIDPAVTYVVIDDVFTTGATMFEATKLLQKAGAKCVVATVICRQPEKSGK